MKVNNIFCCQSETCYKKLVHIFDTPNFSHQIAINNVNTLIILIFNSITITDKYINIKRK